MNIKEKARQIKSDIPAVLIALRDPDTPLLAKIMAGLTVAYFASPIDLIPDFIPVLGFLDDVLILPGMIYLSIKLIGKEQFEKCRQKAKDYPRGKWYYALPILLIWALVIYGLVKVIFATKN